MRKVLLLMTALTALAGSAGANPLLEKWTAPFGVPPFDRIAATDFEPAYRQAIAAHEAEIAAITADPAAPTFANTIEALDRAGADLDRVRSVFGLLNGTMTDEAMQQVAKTMAPILSRHRDAVMLDEALFKRVDAVYRDRADLDLDPEQARLLEETWKGFVRGGAKLDPAQKEEFKQLNEQLSLLQVQFGENVLKETNRWELVIDDEADLAGLPQGVVDAAAEAAEQRGHAGKWVITLHKPSFIPFLQYAKNRELRRQVFEAYANMANHGDELDNNAVLVEIADLRARRAQLLGFPTHADYVLDDNMAKTPTAVYELLRQVWDPAVAKAKDEVAGDAGHRRRRGRRLPAAALGLVVLRREGEEGEVRPGRGHAAPLLRAGQGARGRLRRGGPAVRPDLHQAHRHPGLAPGRGGLRGQGRATAPPSPC